MQIGADERNATPAENDGAGCNNDASLPAVRTKNILPSSTLAGKKLLSDQ